MKIPFRNVRAYFFIKKRNLVVICLLAAFVTERMPPRMASITKVINFFM